MTHPPIFDIVRTLAATGGRPRRSAAALGVALAFAASAPAQAWQVHPATGPVARQLGRLAWHAQRGELVLFGGNDSVGNALGDTWRFDGVAWSQVFPNSAPPPLVGHDMCHDVSRGATVLFGGNGPGGTGFRDDTWEWDGTDWLLRAPAVAPSARVSLAMAFDPLRSVVVLFGGLSSAGVLADTWEYDGTDWTQRTTATVPPPRARHAMAFDAALGRVVMFGGGVPGALQDTWLYDGVDWQQLASGVNPPPQLGHRLVQDPVRNATILVGGFDPGTGGVAGTWELTDGEWHEYRLAGGPAGGATNTAAAFDAARSLVVTFGGLGSVAVDETWEFGGALPSFARFGANCAGTAGPVELDAVSLPALGASLDLEVRNVPFGLAVLAASLGRATATLPGTACELYVALPFVASVGPAAAGTASFAIGIPNQASLAGAAVWFQGATFDPIHALGLATSGAGRAVLH